MGYVYLILIISVAVFIIVEKDAGALILLFTVVVCATAHLYYDKYINSPLPFGMDKIFRKDIRYKR